MVVLPQNKVPARGEIHGVDVQINGVEHIILGLHADRGKEWL